MKSVNESNRSFYDSLYKSSGVTPYYTKAGLSTHKDLKIALENEFLTRDRTASILVIGAGDGREVEFLQSQNYSNITAIDNNAQAVEILHKKFGNSLSIIHGDIKEWQSETPFACVIWMWCGFSDFSREEQKSLMHRVMTLVKPGGIFLLDNPVESSMMNVEPSVETKYNEQTISHFFETSEGAKYRGYVTKSPEIHRWAGNAGVKQILSVQYLTDTNRERKLYCLRKELEIIKIPTQNIINKEDECVEQQSKNSMSLTSS